MLWHFSFFTEEEKTEEENAQERAEQEQGGDVEQIDYADNEEDEYDNGNVSITYFFLHHIKKIDRAALTHPEHNLGL